MPVIRDIYSLLRFEEGDRQFVYDDATGQPITQGSHVIGHPTCGVGRALDIEGLSYDERSYLLRNNVSNWYAKLAAKAWFAALDEIRRAAIIDMAHAQGLAGVEKYIDMIAALERRDWNGAHDAVLDSDWARSPRTASRARRVAEMLRDGVWPAWPV